MITNRIVDKDAATVMVLGGGVAGMRAAIDLAEAGIRVKLVEASNGLGGRVAQLGFMFPTHDCVLCRGTSDHGYGCTRPVISPAFMDHNLHPNIEVWTNTQVLDVMGEAGDFAVTLRHFPRHVNSERCTNCGRCAEVCPVEKPRGFEAGLATRRAAYKIAPRAIPNSYIIDRGPYCDDCRRCEQVCPTRAIDLNETTFDEDERVDAIILAVGYQLYDPRHSEEFGYGRFANVISSMEYERLASRSGPTEGMVTRPSDGTAPKKIAWLQCIGSRDQSHPYCSSICCMYATKEYHIDYTRCRLSSLKEDPVTRNLIVRYSESSRQVEEEFDLVVLSVGMEPPGQAAAVAKRLGIALNAYGFCETDKFAPLETNRPGVYVCGAFQSPKEIAENLIDASGAAAEVMRLLSTKNVKYVKLPCTGKIDIRYILAAFEQGADGVYVVACPLGNCHHVKGNERGKKRVERAKRILDQIGVGGERLDMFFMSGGQGKTFANAAQTMVERVKKLGPNPVKK